MNTIFLIVISLLILSAIIFIFFIKPSQLSVEENNFIEKLGRQYLSIKTPVAAKDETHVPIAEMYILPCRGIRAAS